MKKMFATFVCVMGILFSLWFLWSWADIVADNGFSNPTHSEYNMFVVMLESAEKN